MCLKEKSKGIKRKKKFIFLYKKYNEVNPGSRPATEKKSLLRIFQQETLFSTSRGSFQEK